MKMYESLTYLNQGGSQKVENKKSKKTWWKNEMKKKLKQKAMRNASKLQLNYTLESKGIRNEILIVIRRNVCPLLLSSFAQRRFITVEHGAGERT